MYHDDRGGIRHPSGRRLLTAYTQGYAAAMARAHRDLTRLNAELTAALEQVRADVRVLKAIVYAPPSVRRQIDELVERERQIAQARGAQSNPDRPLN
jgi:hypothetical protein